MTTIDSFLGALKDAELVVIPAHSDPTEIGRRLIGRVAVSLAAGLPANIVGRGLQFSKGPKDASLSSAVANKVSDWCGEAPLADLMGRPSAEIFKSIAFLVKDASPDSLFAALLVQAHLCGVSVDEGRLQAWLQAVTRWDQGFMPINPFACWPALASALSHAHFPFPQVATSSPPNGRMTGVPYQVAWDRSFRFLIEGLLAGWSPENVPEVVSGLGVQANIALRRLRQIYERTKIQATTLQLSVPLRDVPGRRVTVDAIVYVEHEPSDAMKIFGRADPTSAGGRGYKLGVSYRPTVNNSNRFTIHADPTEGLDLTSLWVELERRETNAYRDEQSGRISRQADACSPSREEFDAISFGSRDWLPIDSQGPKSFDTPDLDLLDNKTGRARTMAWVNNVWSNPWFILSDASLIGSPGKNADNIEAEPSMLAWESVVDSIWTTFHPLIDVNVYAHTSIDNPIQKVATPLFSSPELNLGQFPGSPRFRYLTWPRATEQTTLWRAIETSDFNVTVLAALAEQSSSISSVSLANLPPRAACHLITLSGGFAVLSHRGVVVVDDWRDSSLDSSQIMLVFRKVATLNSDLAGHLRNLTQLNQVVATLSEGRPQEKDSYQLIRDIAAARSVLLNQRIGSASETIRDSNSRLLFEGLNGFWGLTDLEKYLEKGYEQLEYSAKSLQEARSARLLRYLAIFGFPAAIASNISKPLANGINAFFVSHGWYLTQQPAPIRDALVMLGELVSWFFCAAGLIYLMNLLYKKLDPSATGKEQSV